MFETFFDLFLSRPSRIALLGHCVFRFFAFLIFFGIVGHLAITASALVASIGRQVSAAPELGTLYPNLPTFFIPETFAGFSVSLFMTGFGLAMVHFGNKWRRILEM